MIRVALKLAVAAAALAALWSFVPIRGRTLADRWRSAGSPAVFVERGWAEASAALGRPDARPQARTKRPGADRRPAEGHTEADRRAVDRILTQHLRDGS